MPDNRIRIRAELDDKVSGPLDKMRDRFDTLGKSKGFQSIVSGIGLGIGQQAWQYATSNIVGAIGDAIEAAKEEEVSVQRLGSALKANIPAWDGNTTSIEHLLTARMKLGFSDDEQRDSLARLVAATHDVNKALDIQRTAMDLARFKGISLADASDALTKVEAGSYRILKSLGIALKDGATQTEALAAVQAIAAGQAEDYAQTNTGKLLVSQVKVNEAMEKFGTVILPVVASGTELAAEKIDKATGLLDRLSEVTLPGVDSGLTDIAGNLLGLLEFDPFRMIGDSVDSLLDGLDSLGVDTGKVRKIYADFGITTTKTTDEVTTAVEGMKGAVDWSSKGTVGAITDITTASNDLAKNVKIDTRSVEQYFGDMSDAIAGDARKLIDEAFDPIIAHNNLVADNAEIASQREIIASNKAKKAQKDAARDVIEATTRDAAEQLVVMAEAGQTNSKAFRTGLENLRTFARHSTGTTKTYLQGVIDKIEQLERIGKRIPINLYVSAHGLSTHPGGHGFLEWAEGGWVDAPKGQPVVGVVHGGEYVIPADVASDMKSGVSLASSSVGPATGGGMTFVYSPTYSTASAVEAQRFMRAIVPELTREMRRQSIV